MIFLKEKCYKIFMVTPTMSLRTPFFFFCEPPVPSAQFVGYTIENPLITGHGTTFLVVSPDNGSGYTTFLESLNQSICQKLYKSF